MLFLTLVPCWALLLLISLASPAHSSDRNSNLSLQNDLKKRKSGNYIKDQRCSKKSKISEHTNPVLNAIKKQNAQLLKEVLSTADICFENVELMDHAVNYYDASILKILIDDSRVNIRASNDRCLCVSLRRRCYPVLLSLASRYYRESIRLCYKKAVLAIIYAALDNAGIDFEYRFDLAQVFQQHGINLEVEIFESILLDYRFLDTPRKNFFPNKLKRIGLYRGFLPPKRIDLAMDYLKLRGFKDFNEAVSILTQEFGIEVIRSQLVYHSTLPIIRAFAECNLINDEDVSEDVRVYLKRFEQEYVRKYPENFLLHHEERFWMNALLDSNGHRVFVDKVYRLGALFTRDSILFSHTAAAMTGQFYTSALHIKDAIPKQSLSPSESRALESLYDFLLDLNLSGWRFAYPLQMDEVKEKISKLNPGETFAHDIQTLSHAVVGLITRSHDDGPEGDGLYDMKIINTGGGAPITTTLPFRIVPCVEQIAMPLSVILDHYMEPIKDIKDIYIPRYMKRTIQELSAESSVAETSRGQRSGTCPVKRLWMLAKIVLGPSLYMEFKVRFIINFIERLTADYTGLVTERWNSHRATVWMMIIHTPVLEKALLRQLDRIEETDPVRTAFLHSFINDSINRRYAPRLGDKYAEILKL